MATPASSGACYRRRLLVRVIPLVSLGVSLSAEFYIGVGKYLNDPWLVDLDGQQIRPIGNLSRARICAAARGLLLRQCLQRSLQREIQA
jgi:hypothetical protein